MAVRKFKKKVLCVALKRPEDAKGIDYIAAGAAPKAVLTKECQVDIEDNTGSRDLDGIS